MKSWTGFVAVAHYGIGTNTGYITVITNGGLLIANDGSLRLTSFNNGHNWLIIGDSNHKELRQLYWLHGQRMVYKLPLNLTERIVHMIQWCAGA